MLFNNIVMMLRTRGTCYVNSIPSQTRLKRLERIFKCKVDYRSSMFIEGGYVIYLVKEVK